MYLNEVAILCFVMLGKDTMSEFSCNVGNFRTLVTHVQQLKTEYEQSNIMLKKENTYLADELRSIQIHVNRSNKLLLDQQNQIGALREQLNKSQAMAAEQIDRLQNQLDELEKETEIQLSLIDKQNRDTNNTITMNENVINSFQEFNVSFHDLKTKVESFYIISNGSHNDEVGFTAYNADALSDDGYGRLNFSNSAYISDDSFNMTSGVFTCKVPGLYVFTATIVGQSSTAYSCYFYINGVSTLHIYAHVYYYSNPSASGTALVKLRKYDTVYLGSCTAVTYLYKYGASFSGFLVVADNE